MEETYNKIECECGQKITFVDSWQEGCRSNDDIILTCNKCKSEIKSSTNDNILNLDGAEWKYDI